ncbi:carbon-nitrogen hydrolase [Patescibacteria group bacterium]|nr:MAG: carbon-nitrogen hydrolase [Patescibacteria group bacterium]
MSHIKKIVTLGLIQMQCDDDPKKNLATAIKKIQACAKKGAQIIVLPELFLSKYFCQEKNEKNFALAETIPGAATEILGQLAKENRLVIICSLFEKKANKYFNTIAVIGTDGRVLGAYRKMHIPSLPPDLYAEDYYFEKGDKFKVFDTAYGKIGTLICYDQWFPEAARYCAALGAQILVYPTAIGWPLHDPQWKKNAEHEAWQITQRSHGIDSNVFVAAVNRVGLEKNMKFWGASFASDCYGRVIAKASSNKEENIIVKCDLGLIELMREEWPMLSERRIKVENQKIL